MKEYLTNHGELEKVCSVPTLSDFTDSQIIEYAQTKGFWPSACPVYNLSYEKKTIKINLTSTKTATISASLFNMNDNDIIYIYKVYILYNSSSVTHITSDITKIEYTKNGTSKSANVSSLNAYMMYMTWNNVFMIDHSGYPIKDIYNYRPSFDTESFLFNKDNMSHWTITYADYGTFYIDYLKFYT